MKSLIFVCIIYALFCGTLAQFKTGIKTRQPIPPQQSEDLRYNPGQEFHSYNHEQQQYEQNAYERYGGNFKPAEYYQGEPLVKPSRAPAILDPTAEFINKTRAGIADGVCFKEVP